MNWRRSLAGPGAGRLNGTISRHTYLGTDIHVAVTLTDGVEVASRFQTMHPLDSRTLPC